MANRRAAPVPPPPAGPQHSVHHPRRIPSSHLHRRSNPTQPTHPNHSPTQQGPAPPHPLPLTSTACVGISVALASNSAAGLFHWVSTARGARAVAASAVKERLGVNSHTGALRVERRRVGGRWNWSATGWVGGCVIHRAGIGPSVQGGLQATQAYCTCQHKLSPSAAKLPVSAGPHLLGMMCTNLNSKADPAGTSTVAVHRWPSVQRSCGAEAGSQPPSSGMLPATHRCSPNATCKKCSGARWAVRSCRQRWLPGVHADWRRAHTRAQRGTLYTASALVARHPSAARTLSCTVNLTGTVSTGCPAPLAPTISLSAATQTTAGAARRAGRGQRGGQGRGLLRAGRACGPLAEVCPSWHLDVMDCMLAAAGSLWTGPDQFGLAQRGPHPAPSNRVSSKDWVGAQAA